MSLNGPGFFHFSFCVFGFFPFLPQVSFIPYHGNTKLNFILGRGWKGQLKGTEFRVGKGSSDDKR